MATHGGAKRRKPPKPNAETLAALGAERLAELLVAAARSDASLKRLLTIEVAQDASDVAEEIDKQLQRIRTAKGRINASRAITLARELERLLTATSSKLGGLDPALAVERLLDVLAAAPDILARRKGEARPLLDAFASIGSQIAPLLAAVPAGPARTALLSSAYRAAVDDDLGLTDNLLLAAAQAVSAVERAILRAEVEADLGALESSGARRAAIAQRIQVLTGALAQIADADGELDGFLAAQERRDPRLRDHLGMASRLLSADRATQALMVLDEASAGLVRASQAFAELRIDALEAAGRRDDAQTARWALFSTSLSADALRAFLKRLPDFEDVEREEEALAHAEQHPDATAVLAFLLTWKDHRRAAALVRRRGAQLDGHADLALAAAAEQLAHKDPLAATLLYRITIDATLSRSRVAGYGRAAQSLLECASLAGTIADWEGRADHAGYVARLRSSYGRQARFWRKAAR